MTATACCTSNQTIYQIQVITRSQVTSILPRSTLSPSSSASIISISEIRKPNKLNKIIKSDVNNNNTNTDNNDDHQITNTNNQQIFNATNDNETEDDIDPKQFLALIGLRHKHSKKSPPISTIRPLAKRLAAPICLLPLPKYGERVRQALTILLPFLKFLSIINDIDLFCSTDENTQSECLLPRSVTQTRTSKTTNKMTNKRKVSKSEFISMAANTLRNDSKRTPMAKYINATIQCQVLLDRLDQSAIDQLMENSNKDDQKNVTQISKRKRSLRNTSQEKQSVQRCLNQTTTHTTITTMTTEQTTVKHKSTKTSYNDAKRFKSSNDDCINISDDNNNNNNQARLAYERIYLKCFVCSKCEYINAKITNSDVLHLHWLEHGNDLSLNIYDSIIDSILTRVVEFFHFPKRHTLEGKIQTVFILNSKEIRKTTPEPLDDDKCIVLD